MSSQPRDLVRGRGERGSSPLGTSIFVGLRLLDAFVIQRVLQTWDPLPNTLVRLGLVSNHATTKAAIKVSESLFKSLAPFQSIIWAMSIGSAVKQIIWILGISKEPMYWDGALMICAFNTILNGMNTVAASMVDDNPTWTASAVMVATPLYAAGILVELISEIQRKRFKDDPRNEGKPYAGGLFGYARSINYFGYTVWRAAFALAGGGWVWGAVVALGFAKDFGSRAIPVMDRYCSGRYGEQWQQLKKRVPYAFCPGWY